MPSLNTGIQRIKQALATSSAIPYMTHYLIKDGFVYATDARLMARSPVDLALNFMAPAKDLERAIRDDSTYEIANTLKIKTGRTRINLTITQDITEYPNTEGFPNQDEGHLIDSDFVRILLKAAKYVSKDASRPWAMGAMVTANNILATNTKIIAEFKLPNPAPISVLFPNWLLEFLSTAQTMPTKIWMPPSRNGGPSSHIYLMWPDGTSVRGSTLSEEYDSRVTGYFNTFPEPTWEITADWRAAFIELSSVVQGDLVIHPDKMVVTNPNSTAEIEIETPTEQARPWTTKEMDEVLSEATHINFNAPGGHASWKGLTSRGMLGGRTNTNARN